MLHNPKWEKTEERWRQILRVAAGLLEERGWSRDYFQGDGGSMCLHGSINYAGAGYPGLCYIDDDTRAAHNAIAHYLHAKGEARVMLAPYGEYEGGWAAGWNNMPERKPEEVIGALRAAAEMVTQPDGWPANPSSSSPATSAPVS